MMFSRCQYYSYKMGHRIVGGLVVNQRQQQHSRVSLIRSLTSSSSSKKSSSSSSSSSNTVIWKMATFAAVGTTFVVAGNVISNWKEYFNNNNEDNGIDAPVQPQAEITSKVYWDITINDKPVGRIVLGLHGNVVPKTVKNFETLCVGDQYAGKLLLSYKNVPFHRCIPGFMIQTGDFTMQNGMGGRSIYNTGYFNDENFQLKHIGKGILSMANAGANTNGSQVFITLTKTKHLDNKHVVFGVVIDGWDIVRIIESYGTSSGKTTANIRITNCGILHDDK